MSDIIVLVVHNIVSRIKCLFNGMETLSNTERQYFENLDNSTIMLSWKLTYDFNSSFARYID